jgi:hypothetical protein
VRVGTLRSRGSSDVLSDLPDGRVVSRTVFPIRRSTGFHSKSELDSGLPPMAPVIGRRTERRTAFSRRRPDLEDGNAPPFAESASVDCDRASWHNSVDSHVLSDLPDGRVVGLVRQSFGVTMLAICVWCDSNSGESSLNSLPLHAEARCIDKDAYPMEGYPADCSASQGRQDFLTRFTPPVARPKRLAVRIKDEPLPSSPRVIPIQHLLDRLSQLVHEARCGSLLCRVQQTRHEVVYGEIGAMVHQRVALGRTQR